MKLRDIILIAAILVVALAAFLFVELGKEDGARVVVAVEGSEIATYSLFDNGEYALNGGTNILHIENGVAWLVDANCPDKLCVHQGKIDKTGEVITCLPNKLTVTVKGADSGDEPTPDLIS